MDEMDDLPGLGTLLRRLLTALDGDVQKVYDSLGVPFRPRFFPIVQHLRKHGATHVGALSKYVGVSQPAITQTLAEIRAAGLVTADTGGDRRARLVRLTDEGEALSVRLEPVWRGIHRAAAALDAELPVPLRAVLSTAVDRLESEPFHARIRQQLED
jgi:DNA-binding MarR family transcriptional regulator